MRKFIATLAMAGVLLVGGASAALAWHVEGASATRDCEGVTLSVTIPDEEWLGEGTGTLTSITPVAGVTDSGGAGETLSVFMALDSAEPAGVATGEVTWSNSEETEAVEAQYGAVEGCEEEETKFICIDGEVIEVPVSDERTDDGSCTSPSPSPEPEPSPTPEPSNEPPVKVDKPDKPEQRLGTPQTGLAGDAIGVAAILAVLGILAIALTRSNKDPYHTA